KNRPLDQLTKVLSSCIRTEWKNMETFAFPYGNDVELTYPREVQAEALARVLAQSATLHTVTAAMALDHVPRFIHTLCDIPTLKTIQFTRPLRSQHAEKINSNPKLKSLARYTTEKSCRDNCTTPPDFAPEILPSLNPSFVPLKSASDATRDLIWRNVLFFAMYVEELRDRAFPRGPTDSHPSRLPILQVSRYFHRLGLPYLYDSLNLTYSSMPQIAQALRERPGLGSNIRVVLTSTNVLGDTPRTILSRAHNLQLLQPKDPRDSGCVMSSQNFRSLADIAGSSLRELHLYIHDAPLSSSLITKFTALRTLELEYSVSMSKKRSLLALMSTAITTTAAMEFLHTLRFHGMNSLILRFFIPMRLDALHTVAMPVLIDDTSMFLRFLEAHGSHLLHLVLPNNLRKDARALDLCPNLQVLEFPHSIKPSQISLDAPHPFLNKIIARELTGDYFKGESEMLPALREIHLTHFQWPATE
ncbi:hypothetical protein R3P38DRAFT_2540994, partial [Favolaschia claudopus]